MMNNIAAIDNREKLHHLLLSLDKNVIPLWGKMTPQQMVEHMIDQVQYTNGTKQPTCDVNEEKAAMAKQLNIYTNLQIPRNVILGTLPDRLIYPNLASAINQLMTELAAFDNYFTNAGTLVLHGGFGAMDYSEWIIWHSKHLSHHLKQFGLIF